MRHLNVARPLAVYVVIYLACIAAAVSCSENQRLKTVNVAVMSLDTAEAGFMVWTKEHQKAIIAKATSKADAEAKLSAYLVERDQIKDGVKIVYKALALAATKTDDASLQAAMTAAADLYVRIKAFTESFTKKPPAPPPEAPASSPDGGV